MSNLLKGGERIILWYCVGGGVSDEGNRYKERFLYFKIVFKLR